MNMLLMWIFIGMIVGTMANFLEISPNREKLILSVGAGVVGAVMGGIIGEAFTAGDRSFANPLLFTMIGSFLSVVLPRNNRVL
jgi:uncharacterized membrane protein YeaQ/YmgE (transglycosylase-associated protein family)